MTFDPATDDEILISAYGECRFRKLDEIGAIFGVSRIRFETIVKRQRRSTVQRSRRVGSSTSVVTLIASANNINE